MYMCTYIYIYMNTYIYIYLYTCMSIIQPLFIFVGALGTARLKLLRSVRPLNEDGTLKTRVDTRRCVTGLVVKPYILKFGDLDTEELLAPETSEVFNRGLFGNSPFFLHSTASSMDMYVHVHEYIYVYTHVYKRMYACMHACMNACM